MLPISVSALGLLPESLVFCCFETWNDIASLDQMRLLLLPWKHLGRRHNNLRGQSARKIRQVSIDNVNFTLLQNVFVILVVFRYCEVICQSGPLGRVIFVTVFYEPLLSKVYHRGTRNIDNQSISRSFSRCKQSGNNQCVKMFYSQDKQRFLWSIIVFLLLD